MGKGLRRRGSVVARVALASDLGFFLLRSKISMLYYENIYGTFYQQVCQAIGDALSGAKSKYVGPSLELSGQTPAAIFVTKIFAEISWKVQDCVSVVLKWSHFSLNQHFHVASHYWK